MSTPEKQLHLDEIALQDTQINLEQIQKLQSPSSLKGDSDSKKDVSGKASAGQSSRRSFDSKDFQSAEGNEEDPSTPPADPPVDTHQRQIGTRPHNPRRDHRHYNGSAHVLSDNTQILKGINMNKMQHQYIQNLQKSNMTLKCKIKEISEIQTQQDLERATELSDEVEVVSSDEDFQLQELGTIEEMHQSRRPQKRKERGFYDKNSIGRKASKHRPKEPELKYRPKEKPEESETRDPKNKTRDANKDTKKKSKRKEEEYDEYYHPGYYHEDYYREWYYGEEYYHAFDRYHSQYLNRYERMSRYGPYDEDAAYPYDYFEKHWKSKKQPTHKKGWVEEDQQRDYQESDKVDQADERGYRKYFVYKEGHVQVNEARMQKASKQPLVWKQKGQDPRDDPPVWKQKGSQDDAKPPAKRGRSKKENRDLRPATFIKDLHKRSQGIEEEKAQHRKKKARAPEKSVLTEKLTPDSHMARIKRAIAKQDLTGLTDAIYEAKVKNLKGGEIQKLVQQAEEAIVHLSAQN